jgi:ribosomal protein S18 acetylase RimI-like enzyme
MIKSNIGDLTIRKAEDADKSMVIHIKQEAARWLENRGIPQWAGILMAPGEDMVHKRFPEGEFYLAYKGEEPVGTVTILWEDPVSWGEKGKDGKAGYIHGIAILRQYAGKGVGKALLDWAMGKIREKGKVVRLDCMAENPRINKYYTDLDFTSAGTAILPSGFKISLYEKR